MNQLSDDVARWRRAGQAEEPLTRAEWVDQRLRRAILDGEFAPGERLRPAELTERWSVSPTPVREALQRLATEGLVETEPQRGARVAPVSKADLLDLYNTRLRLEPHALELSIMKGDEAYRTEVADAFRSLETEYRREPVDRSAREWAHRTFHLGVLSACGSQWMLRLISTLVDHAARYRMLSTMHRGSADNVISEHERITEACLAEDAPLGAALLQDHLERTIHTALIELEETDTS